MVSDSPPYWRLIAVLFSSFPLTAELARRLHRCAYELHRSDRDGVEIEDDPDLIVSGHVRNLKQAVALGTITGPSFEADIETERGKGIVRFLLTHQGIELMAEQTASMAN